MLDFLVKYVNERYKREMDKKDAIISKQDVDIAERDKELNCLKFKLNTANSKIMDLSRRLKNDPEKEKLREELERAIADCNKLTYENGRLHNFIEEVEERNWRLCDIVEKVNKVRSKRLLNETVTIKGSKDNEIKE